MGVARPVIASVDAHSETAEVITQAKCGLCLEPEDPKALADAILEVYGDKARADDMGQRGRQYVERHYTRTSVARQYEAVFARLLSSPDTLPSVHKPDTASL